MISLRRPFLASLLCACGCACVRLAGVTRTCSGAHAQGAWDQRTVSEKSGGLLLLRAAVLVHSRARFGALGLATGPRACGVGVVPGGRVLQRSRVRVGSRLAAQVLPVVAVMQANIELAEVRTYVGMFASTRMLESACVLQHTTMVSPAATLFR